MKKVMVAFMALAFSCGIAFAQQGSTSQGSKSKTEKMTGTVESIDASAMTMTVKDKKGATHNLTMGQSAQIQKDGSTAKLSDIKPGDKVTVHWTGTKENPQVQQVQVKSGKEKGAAGGTQKGAGTSQGGQQKGAGSSQGGAQGSQSPSSSPSSNE